MMKSEKDPSFTSEIVQDTIPASDANEKKTDGIEGIPGPGPEENPDWAHDALADLEEWIESQGIYIRQ